MRITSTVAIRVALAVPAAHAEDFDFAFSTLSNNDGVDSKYTGGGFTPGTVTGELIGLSSNGTSSPTDVLLFSNPDHVPDGDLYAQGWFNALMSANTFTVSNGQVTGDDFTLYSVTTNQELILGGPSGGAADNLLINYIFDQATGNLDGLDGVAFTPVDVPEPANFGILAMGLVMAAKLGSSSFLKKRTKRLLRYFDWSARGWRAWRGAVG